MSGVMQADLNLKGVPHLLPSCTESYFINNEISSGKEGGCRSWLVSLPLRKILCIIDGTHREQVDWALGVYEAKIVIEKGFPLRLTKKHQRIFYADYGGVIARYFNIRSLPAIVYIEKGKCHVLEGQSALESPALSKA